MYYLVEIKETLSRVVAIEADSQLEAIEGAEELYREGRLLSATRTSKAPRSTFWNVATATSPTNLRLVAVRCTVDLKTEKVIW